MPWSNVYSVHDNRKHETKYCIVLVTKPSQTLLQYCTPVFSLLFPRLGRRSPVQHRHQRYEISIVHFSSLLLFFDRVSFALSPCPHYLLILDDWDQTTIDATVYGEGIMKVRSYEWRLWHWNCRSRYYTRTDRKTKDWRSLYIKHRKRILILLLPIFSSLVHIRTYALASTNLRYRDLWSHPLSRRPRPILERNTRLRHPYLPIR